MKQPIMITKASGKKALFDGNKVSQSLQRVGADDDLIEEVLAEISKSLAEGTSTHKIYQIAFRLLRKKSRTLAAKYHLKQAIMQLGKSGYPFEKYVAEILRHQGYRTQNNQLIEGYCVTHEVDVVAKRNNQTNFVECKYHNRLGINCDVKISLYFNARFMDIEKAYVKHGDEKLSGWIVTNTRFTTDAMKYGLCAGLRLIGWDYPVKGSLKEQIEFSGLYPITCIKNLTTTEITDLLANDIILCQSISDKPSLLNPLRLSKSRMDSILHQCHALSLDIGKRHE